MDDARRAVLRAAAITAVLVELEAGADRIDLGRGSGPVWVHDHRLTLAGRGQVLRTRAARSTWR